MLNDLAAIHPLSSWALLVLATALFVAGFLAYSHAQLAWRAFGERSGGPGGSGTVATMGRWSVALIAGGLVVWGVMLGWSALGLVLLGAVAVSALGIEAAVRVLG